LFLHIDYFNSEKRRKYFLFIECCFALSFVDFWLTISLSIISFLFSIWLLKSLLMLVNSRTVLLSGINLSMNWGDRAYLMPRMLKLSTKNCLFRVSRFQPNSVSKSISEASTSHQAVLLLPAKRCTLGITWEWFPFLFSFSALGIALVLLGSFWEQTGFRQLRGWAPRRSKFQSRCRPFGGISSILGGLVCS